jgi:hypothetical protein
MQNFKPIRVIDICKNLNLATATVIEFLKKKHYPVERLHHTPLLPDILNDIARELAGGYNIAIFDKMLAEARGWETEHSEIANDMRQSYQTSIAKSKLRQERTQKMIAGRERARITREKFETLRQQYGLTMKSLVEAEASSGDGRIAICPLQMELIRRSIALKPYKKIELLNYLRSVTDTSLLWKK